MQHQDWDEVVLRKETQNKNNIKKQPKPSAKEIDKVNNFDPDAIQKPTLVGLSLGSAIQKARADKNMSQADLDKACSLPKNTIQKYESNKATYNAAEVNKISNVLGVALPRPQKQQKQKD